MSSGLNTVSTKVLLADIGTLGTVLTATIMMLSAAENIYKAEWNVEGRTIMWASLGASVAAAGFYANLGLEVEQIILLHRINCVIFN